MKIKCLHGYFKMYETHAGEISRFATTFDLDLTFKDGYFTFETLAAAPRYSLLGFEYLNATATKTFEGEPWDVMEANGLIYDFGADELVPIQSIMETVVIAPAGHIFYSGGLILPGSTTDSGARVKEYAAWYSFDTNRFRYSEVGYVDVA